MEDGWDDEQAHLQERALEVRRWLDIDQLLVPLGTVTLVGSAALGVMVARDIDLTVTVPRLNSDLLRDAASVAATLSLDARVREVIFRNDTGQWNTDPDYPDGLYLRAECRDDADELWTLDIWFVDDPSRQPDLHHVRLLGPLITLTTQVSILEIKRATRGRRRDGTRLPSFDIYQAVLYRGVRTPEEFEALR